MMRFVLILLLTACAHGADIRGLVIDATTREPVAKVAIRALGTPMQATTGSDGRFSFTTEGRPQLLFSSVGYRPYKVDAPEDAELEVALIPDTLRQSEKVEVTAGPYALETASSVSLAGSELRNLASVLADDPLRALQGLPGVTANDDFSSQLSLRGAGFQRIGVFIDGILLHSPYHALQADPSSASLTILSSDLLERAELHSGPMPVPFADRTAGLVDLRLRDGDRKKFGGRASASASNVSVVVEGPLSRTRRGSWLLSARKSYLQYIIERSSDEPSIAFGFSDIQGRLAWDLTSRHAVTLSVMHGSSGLDRTGAESSVGINTFFRSDYAFTLAKTASRWTPTSRLLFNNTVAFIRERFENLNRNRDPLAFGHYGEWVGNSDNTWQWAEQATLLFGGSLRRLRDNGYLDRRLTGPPFATRLDEYRGTALRSGAHLAQQVRLFRGKLWLQAGGRFDHHEVTGHGSLTPNAALTLQAAARSQVHLAWGQYVQFPELSQLYSRFGRPTLLPERASQFELNWEQRLDDKTRFRAGAYQRLDRDLLFRPLFEPRILSGRVYSGNSAAPIQNSVRGYGRGLQFFLQRRTSNGITGWVSYSYGIARLREGTEQQVFSSDYDQRHTANVYLSYRIRPTINLSTRWVYGSGFPVRGYFSGTEAQFFLASSRNLLRIPEYHRMDFRANKTFVRRGLHITLYAEVVNLYNHTNARFDELRSFDARTGTARLGFDKLFPILPSAGVAIEF